jgi:hypothetical protein
MVSEKPFYPFARTEKDRTFPSIGKSCSDFSNYWKINWLRLKLFTGTGNILHYAHMRIM